MACLHLIERGANMFPAYLRDDALGTVKIDEILCRPNLSPEAEHYLNCVGLSVDDLFHHVIAVLHDPAYREANAGALRMEWPRIPLPGWPDGDDDGAADELSASAARGRELAALLDSDTPVPGATEGALRPEIAAVAVPSTVDGSNMAGDDFALTAGWGHFGQGESVMPGQGRIVERPYTPDERAAMVGAASTLGETTFDVYLNTHAYWRNVPPPPSGATSSAATRCSRSGCRTGNARFSADRCCPRRYSTSPTRRGGLGDFTAGERPLNRLLTSGTFWFAGLALVLLVVGLVASVVFWDCLEVFWDWLTDGESGSATIRNLGLVLAAIIALPLAIWRGVVADRQASAAQRQAETAQQSLLNDRYERGAEMLGSHVLSVRLGGIFALARLAEEHPEEYHIQMMELLCAFVWHPPRDANLPEQPKDAEKFILREDVQAALRVIGTRSDKHRRLAVKGAFYINLHGADLRGGDLPGLNFSSPSVDMIESMSLHQIFSNANLRTDMSGAKLDGAQFLFAKISGVDFSRNGKSPATGLTSSQLWGAQWDDANPPTVKGLVDAITGQPLEDALQQMVARLDQSRAESAP